MRLTMPVNRKDRLVNHNFSEPDPKPNLIQKGFFLAQVQIKLIKNTFSGIIEDDLKLSEWFSPTTTEWLSSGLGTPGNDKKKI